MSFVSQIDRYIYYQRSRGSWLRAQTQPTESNWKKFSTPAAESIRIITALLYPVLPFATAKVWAQLGLGDIEAAARDGELNNLEWGGLSLAPNLGRLGLSSLAPIKDLHRL